jgi:hypothetical protein
MAINPYFYNNTNEQNLVEDITVELSVFRPNSNGFTAGGQAQERAEVILPYRDRRALESKPIAKAGAPWASPETLAVRC